MITIKNKNKKFLEIKIEYDKKKEKYHAVLI